MKKSIKNEKKSHLDISYCYSNVLSLDNVSLDNGFLVTVVSRRRYRSCGRLSHHNNVEQAITYKNSEKILMTNVSQKPQNKIFVVFHVLVLVIMSRI